MFQTDDKNRHRLMDITTLIRFKDEITVRRLNRPIYPLYFLQLTLCWNIFCSIGCRVNARSEECDNCRAHLIKAYAYSHQREQWCNFNSETDRQKLKGAYGKPNIGKTFGFARMIEISILFMMVHSKSYIKHTNFYQNSYSIESKNINSFTHLIRDISRMEIVTSW